MAVNNHFKTIDGIGRVLFVKRKGARKMNLFMGREDVLRVSIPYWVSFKNAEKVLTDNIGWVQRYIRDVERLRREHVLLAGNLKFTEKESAEKILKRFEGLAKRSDFTYNSVVLRENKTSWGSCSPGNDIRLNIKLARLPDKLIDYVIMHELVHTRIKDHRKGFWDSLSGFIPEARELDRVLRRYQPGFL